MTLPKKIHRCPCCEQLLAEPIGFREKLHLGVMQARLFHALRRAPDGLTAPELHGILYAQASDGGPDVRVISVMAKHINRKIIPLGLKIRGTGGPGSVFHLLQVPQCGL